MVHTTYRNMDLRIRTTNSLENSESRTTEELYRNDEVYLPVGGIR